MKLIIIEKKKEIKRLSPHFCVETEQDEEKNQPHVKVIWDNHSTCDKISHIRVIWDNEKPGNVRIEIDGEEKSLSEIHTI